MADNTKTVAKVYSIKLTEAQHQAMKMIGKQENRNTTNLITCILKEYIDTYSIHHARTNVLEYPKPVNFIGPLPKNQN